MVRHAAQVGGRDQAGAHVHRGRRARRLLPAAGALDGTRPGFYYINLRDTAEVPSWTLPTLTYHECIPGHHLQASLQTGGCPAAQIRRRLPCLHAYIEGWALYAEQLADEMGMYDTDPMGRIGYLHDAPVPRRAAGGRHRPARHGLEPRAGDPLLRRPTRRSGKPPPSTEIDRYCVWPGQACSYMVGKLTWLRCATRPRRRWAPASTSATSTTPACSPGPCRCRCWTWSSPTGSPARPETQA